jgi:hypothetical protein
MADIKFRALYPSATDAKSGFAVLSDGTMVSFVLSGGAPPFSIVIKAVEVNDMRPSKPSWDDKTV